MPVLLVLYELFIYLFILYITENNLHNNRKIDLHGVALLLQQRSLTGNLRLSIAIKI